MTNTISASEILERLKTGQTDFTDLGECQVIGGIAINQQGDIPGKPDVQLGELTFTSSLVLMNQDFGELSCDSAKFHGDFDVNGSSFYSFDCGSAQFQECLGLIGIEVEEKLSCGYAKFAYILCENAKIALVSADKNPAVAWVIQQALQGVLYEIGDAPPWMQKPAVP